MINMKANKKELSAYKKLLVLFSVIVFIICGVVLFWYIAIKQPYERYRERVVVTSEIGYDYQIREPRFLSTRGEIDIKKSDGNFKIHLDISHAFLKKKYELTIAEGSKDSVTIPVDENLNYVTEDYGNIEMRKEKEKILSEYMDEAEEIMHAADIILGLDRGGEKNNF